MIKRFEAALKEHGRAVVYARFDIRSMRGDVELEIIGAEGKSEYIKVPFLSKSAAVERLQKCEGLYVKTVRNGYETFARIHDGAFQCEGSSAFWDRVCWRRHMLQAAAMGFYGAANGGENG